jgi:hypothetical protein
VRESAHFQEEKNMKFGVLAFGVLLAGAGSATAQTEELFAYDQGGGNMYVIQNGAIQRQWNTGTSNLSPIAVSGGTVRASSFFDGGGGSEYDLYGNPTGNGVGEINGDNIYDSTSDGTNNYAVSFGSSFYKFDTLFNNQSTVNSVGWFGQLAGGIAYDGNANSLWISAWSGTNVREMDLNGNPTGRGFQTQQQDTLNMALAFEASSDTIWTIPRDNGSLILHQYSLNGQLLQSINLGVGGNFLSADFGGKVPAPASGAILGLAGLAAIRRRRA